MSCRVIGRNIELAFIDFLVEDLQNLKIKKVYSTYNKTTKNIQVENFYNKLKFNILNFEDKKSSYYLYLEEYIPNKLTYINIHYDRK